MINMKILHSPFLKRESVNMPSKMDWLKMVASLASVGVIVACAAQYQQQEAELQQPTPINCRTAEGDMRMLQHEKAHVAQQIALGVTAISPAGMVVGLLTGTEQAKLQVATGDYNSMIDRRIAEIKSTCGLP
jgi:hypothetical protein